MKFISLLILLCIGLNINAQKIAGIVVEKIDGKEVGIPGVNLFWLGTTKGITTDVDGKFKIDWNASSKLVAHLIGYQSDTVNVNSNSRKIKIELIEGELLDEVKVMKRGSTTVMTTRGAAIEQVITGEELCKAACCNLGESFTTNASVDVAYSDAVTGAKQIQLLGLTGKYVQMMTENMPNFRGISSLYGLGYVPGPWMESISVSKGTVSVINGYEAIAGQISVDYKKPRTSEKLFTNLYASDEGMYEFNLNTGIKLNEKWGTALLIHGDWMKHGHDDNDDSFLDMPEKEQYNFINRWDLKTKDVNLQFGVKYIEESRLGGQISDNAHHSHSTEIDKDKFGGQYLYGIGIDATRVEVFTKLGILMPSYDETSMAILLNYTDHDHDSFYGARNYLANQKNFYANYIIQSVFANNTNHKYSAGLSYNYDNLAEEFNDVRNLGTDSLTRSQTINFMRKEQVAGAFFQYSGHFWDQFVLMAGIRYDYHNIYGGFVTPRVNIAYTPDDMTVFKVSLGQGSRVANILADNGYLLASSNNIYINNNMLVDNIAELNKLDMEKAWNFGVQFNRKFILFDRMLQFNIDYYHTNFVNQIIADNESQAGKVNFHNLDGESYSNTYQAELKYELIPRFDVLAAVRYNDVKTTIGGELKTAPLQSEYKGLLNLSYYTNMKKWQFDFTTQFNGPGRIPINLAISSDIAQPDRFDSFALMNTQITKFFRTWSVYFGCENIANFKQKNPIFAADKPWSSDFDSSKLWGPIHERKFYIGLRFAIDKD